MRLQVAFAERLHESTRTAEDLERAFALGRWRAASVNGTGYLRQWRQNSTADHNPLFVTVTTRLRSGRQKSIEPKKQADLANRRCG